MDIDAEAGRAQVQTGGAEDGQQAVPGRMTSHPLGEGPADTGPQGTPAAPGTAAAPQGAPGPARILAVLRSNGYTALLVLSLILGVPIAAVAYGFLGLSKYLQQELFIHLPRGLGFSAAPAWWPLPVLLAGGVLTALAIQYLPGDGGVSPAGGFGVHPPPKASALPGVILAALASLAFGAVIGPEMPLIAIGSGLAVLATKASRRPVPSRAQSVVGAAGAFAAISTLLGSPLTGAFLIMEATGLGAAMDMVLVPGLLAAGVGALIFVGLDSLTGAGTFSLAIPGLPPFSRPALAEFGWAIVIGVAAAILGPACLWLGRLVQAYAKKRNMIVVPLAGVAVGIITIIYTQVTGKPSSDVLFSGEDQTGTLIHHAAAYSVGALLLLVACKSLAYGASLGGFRGGPIFPSLFIGAAGGIAMSHLPGLPLAAAIAMGVGATCASVMRLPLASVLLASLLLQSDAVKVMPLVIVAVVVAYVTVANLPPQLTGLPATPTVERQAQRPR